MENKIATTEEQSKKLLELGIDEGTADMYWWHYNEKTYLSGMYDGEFNKREEDVPAWSLSALLNVMPKGLWLVKDVEEKYHIYTRVYIGECVSSENPIDTVFEMVVYLKENKLI